MQTYMRPEFFALLYTNTTKGHAMADIEMRFNRDMLVLSSDLRAGLNRLGVDSENDLEFMNLVEPDSIRDLLRLELTAGAQCLVLGTRHMTPAQLAARGMDGRAKELAVAIFTVASQLKPQHILVELAPCELPLDASSKNSLNEHRSQYAEAGRTFAKENFDAFYLQGFTDTVDLKCALMGLRQVSDKPIFASVEVDGKGTLPKRGTLEEAVEVMEEFQASVAGICVAAGIESAVELAKRMNAATSLPKLVELYVTERNEKQGEATAENPYYCADCMVEAATKLRGAGVQFLRAVGKASPAYTGALVAATYGFDVTLS